MDKPTLMPPLKPGLCDDKHHVTTTTCSHGARWRLFDPHQPQNGGQTVKGKLLKHRLNSNLVRAILALSALGMFVLSAGAPHAGH